MGPTVAALSARASATVEDLLRDYPPNPKLRAPKLPGDWLYVANKSGRGDSGVDVAGPRDLSHSPYEAELRRWRVEARKGLLAEAVAWSSAYRDRLPAPQEGAELLLSGHQPEFFHPGVWFKNFLLDAEARAGANARAGERPIVPVNVVIDYDLCTKRNVLHPAIDETGVRLESIDVDRPAPPAPHERSSIVDREFLAEFPQRLHKFREVYWNESGTPIAEPLFRGASAPLASAESFGQFAAVARHRFEETIGLSTLEVPFSRLAEEASFREFAWLLLREAQSFRRTYNASLRAVRVVQKLRSKTHPAPELAERDGWTEAAFWIWTKDDPRRRRLFVRSAGGGFEISDLETIRESIGGGSGVSCGAERLAELSRRWIAIRPRALTATIWMRAVLADGFLHGIGGAKYDQAADLLMGAWFGLEPPAYRIATATFNLTERTPGDAALALAERRRLLRDLQQHPERHAADADATAARGAAKQIGETLVTVARSGIDARTHRELAAARERLREATAEQVDSTAREIGRLERELRDRKILDSRERSFLLFDAETLPCRLRKAAEQAVADRETASPGSRGTSTSE